MARNKPSVYLFFLAISKDQRSKGYGTKLLNFIKDEYKNYQIYIDIEKVDETSLNVAQRVMRKNFYLKNGYYALGYYLVYGGEKFEIMCSDNVLNVNDFCNLFEEIKHIFQAYK